MTRTACMVALLALTAAPAGLARAEERCLPYEEFNAWAESTGGAAVSGRLTFDFTAPSLVDRYRADAVIADMADFRTRTPRGTACSGFQMKSWGDCRLPDDSRCTCSGERCDGVIKMEGFDECGAMLGEAPFTPWHSLPVFTADGRACHLELFFDETTSGYDLTCTGIEVAPGRGENEFGTEITFVSVLENVGGGNAFDGAVLTSAAIFCFDDGVLADAGIDASAPDAASGADDAAAVDAASTTLDASSLDGSSVDASRGGRGAATASCGCSAVSVPSRSVWLGMLAVMLGAWGRGRRSRRF